MKKSGIKLLFTIILGTFLLQSLAFSRRSGYSRDEFMRCRQDNNFYYFTGVEDLNPVLLMAPKTGFLD